MKTNNEKHWFQCKNHALPNTKKKEQPQHRIIECQSNSTTKIKKWALCTMSRLMALVNERKWGVVSLHSHSFFCISFRFVYFELNSFHVELAIYHLILHLHDNYLQQRRKKDERISNEMLTAALSLSQCKIVTNNLLVLFVLYMLHFALC